MVLMGGKCRPPACGIEREAMAVQFLAAMKSSGHHCYDRRIWRKRVRNKEGREGGKGRMDPEKKGGRKQGGGGPIFLQGSRSDPNLIFKFPVKDTFSNTTDLTSCDTSL
jgi:hypothetical protein